MPLFNFKLRDWHEIHPWTTGDGTKCLSWFGFSDGWFWISCGDSELFRYTPEVVSHWGLRPEEVYVDYQVARLWEDILQMLPSVLEEVPADLTHYLSDQDGYSRWRALCDCRLESDREEGEFSTEHLDWVGCRFLDSGYLANGPQIAIWRSGDSICLQWRTAGRLFDGIQLWAAGDGMCSLPVQEFLDEVRSFNDRFVSAMRQQVESIVADWSRNDVAVDRVGLHNEQAQREGELAETLERQSSSDWDKVRASIKMLGSRSGLELKGAPVMHVPYKTRSMLNS